MPPLPAALTSSMLYFQMVIMAGTVMLAYYFEYTDTFTVNVQGFFCHDSAYRKPYPGPEDSSAVPPVLLYSLAAGVPVLVVSPGVLARAPDSHLSPFAFGVEAPRRSGRGSLCLLSSSKLRAAPSPEDILPGRVRVGAKEAPVSPHTPPPHPLRWLQSRVMSGGWEGRGLWEVMGEGQGWGGGEPLG